MIYEELVGIVGAGNVSEAPEVLEAYSKDMSFTHPVRPACVVKPGNAGDVQKIVQLANETLTPLTPVSSGSPHFRGDTVPGVGGAIIADLSGMKKIIRVDRPNRVAMCEPGVTFAELIAATDAGGLRLNAPLAPRQSKSVVGSLLEREPVLMPRYHWDISDPLACVEVVLGTGDVFRTGAAAGPGTIEEQWRAGSAQRASSGPSQASFHRLIQGAQGTMGVVTWTSVACEKRPRVEEPFLVGSTKLERMTELLHWLVKLRLVNECLLLNRANVAAVLAREWPDGRLEAKESLPPWVLLFCTACYDYLPEERLDYQIRDIRDICRRVGLDPVPVLSGIPASLLLDVARRPSAEPYWKLNCRGGCHDIFFLTVYDKLPGLMELMAGLADEAGYAATEMGVYLQPIVQGTNCHCEFNIYYDPQDAVESERVRDLDRKALWKLAAAGAFFSRPYGESARMIMNRDAATARALTKVKAVFDPNNIMNPGKLCF
jgi:FAD/FMN-containing dehydrogenase